MKKLIVLCQPRTSALFLCTAAGAVLSIGLFAPSFVIAPSFGDPVINAIIEELKPGSTAPIQYSIVTGIIALFGHGDIVLACAILAFSVLFPVSKLTALTVLLWTWGSSNSPRRRTLERNCNWILIHLSAWSMLDVFVVAVMVAGFKSFPLGTRFEARWGIVCFGASVVLGIIAAGIFEAMYLHRRQREAES